MAGGIVLEFAQFGAYDSFDIIRSESAMDINNLPAPIATGVTTTTYVDMTVVLDTDYYYRVAVWRDGVRKVGEDEILVAAGSIDDPYWLNVVSLLEIKDGSIVDSAPLAAHTWLQRDIRAVTVVEGGYLSSSSMFFDGVAFLRTSDPLPMGDNDFTIEAFIKPDKSSYNTIASFFNTSGRFTWMTRDSGSNISVWDGSWRFYHAPVLSMNNRWSHVALCRQGNTYSSFVDGKLLGSGTWVSAHKDFAGRDTIVGSSELRGRDNYNGHIEQIRITKGVARYTAEFAPLVQPFPSYN